MKHEPMGGKIVQPAKNGYQIRYYRGVYAVWPSGRVGPHDQPVATFHQLERAKAYVDGVRGSRQVRETPRLDSFTHAYIEAMLWSSDDQGGEPLDANYSMEDIAPETMELIVEDCRDFQGRFGELISDDDPKHEGVHGTRWELAGHDFWLNREGHGAGFWNGDWPRHGEELSEAAQSYGPFELEVGDDGLIHGPPPDMYRNPPEWIAKRHPNRGRANEARRRPSPARHNPNALCPTCGIEAGRETECPDECHVFHRKWRDRYGTPDTIRPAPGHSEGRNE